MKFRKGDVVVITGNQNGGRFDAIGCFGIVHCVGFDLVGVITDYPLDMASMEYYIYKPNELIKIDHIHKRDWKGLDLVGFL